MSRHTIELPLSHLTDPNYGSIPKKSNKHLRALAAPHIDSFNYCTEDGLKHAVHLLNPLEFSAPNGDKFMIQIKDARFEKPTLSPGAGKGVSASLFPKECIERGCSYTGSLIAAVAWKIGDGPVTKQDISMGNVPIMVMSNCCHLKGMSPKQLVRHGELVNDTGGYFIINGTLRVLRLLTSARRNYPLAIVRESWRGIDKHYTEKGIMIRCVREDESVCVNILHYLSIGGAKLEFTVNREAFLIPVILCLKILVDMSDHLIYQYLMKGRENDNFYSEKVKVMMRQLLVNELHSQVICKQYIGTMFRNKLANLIPPWYTDEDVCNFIIRTRILPHLPSSRAKFDALCMMCRKLYAFVGGDCLAESVDGVSHQEVQLGGHTYLAFLKDRLHSYMRSVMMLILTKYRISKENYSMNEAEFKKTLSKGTKVGGAMEKLLSCGIIPSTTDCGLMQTTGLSVILEHINRMRDLSHLRAIHRGSYFSEMKTIGPRRLTGEAWGFICPVHTPDGAPCGLLNHLAYNCVVPCDRPRDVLQIKKILLSLGLIPMDSPPLVPYNLCYDVMLNGELIGFIPKKKAEDIVFKLRYLKTFEKIYKYTEIILIPEREFKGHYPGLFLATTASRMMRPVVNLVLKAVEYIGTLEQIYLNIAVSPEDYEEGVHTHMELEKTAIFSNIGRLVPFSECNPNPRNMYQCQMGKQAMGTSTHNWQRETTAKLYRLQYPQVPLVRNAHYDEIQMDEFCMGFNAVVAIISYTGYDMEDAMILNKSSMERGLAHGQVYKSEFVDLRELNPSFNKNDVVYVFQRDPRSPELENFLDALGLPYPGVQLHQGDPYYCYYDIQRGMYRVVKYKGETCVVDKYTIMSAAVTADAPQRACISLRIKRNPNIGDKFASRSGQKGIMSRLYPVEDLPFSERGIIPDIIFNPHGIPSRMTAGKLIELVAGKSAAEFGISFDSTPFQFSDENPAVDYFGKVLEKAGFNYYGEDVLYSGTDGRMMQVEIFEGIIYYQRLRHMTADKWQVRAKGPCDIMTRQPIKGRKKGGAIRFGEMERDCMISHGAAFCLKDRLLDCSDDTLEWVCVSCGNFFSLCTSGGGARRKPESQAPECLQCSESRVRLLHIPYAFRLLAAELASVGVKLQLSLLTAEDIIKKNSMPRVVAKA